MLEAGNSLHTWRLACAPTVGSDPIDATELPDHRVAYLDYEGPVGGNRGSVRRWDAGTFTWEADSKPDVRLLRLNGTRIAGHVRLVRVAGTEWRFSCRESVAGASG